MTRLEPLLLIDKPKGISSFSLIRQLRRRTGEQKMGHAGTLDPLASGLMLIGVGKGTKQLTALVGLDKEYIAEILIGEKRITGDMAGDIIKARDYLGDITTLVLSEIIESMIGDQTLPVSVYSAIRRNGKQMYKHAVAARRKGEAPPTPPVRLMKVYEAEILRHETVQTSEGQRLLVEVRFKVSSGTYIRSLAEEFGRRLGYPATLFNLRRTKVGEYRIEDARQLGDFGSFLERQKQKIRIWLRGLKS